MATLTELVRLDGRAELIGEVFDQVPGYGVLSGRKSFMPAAAYYNGPPLVNDIDSIRAAPVFAVEIRRDSDSAAKRADYFAAGTLVVWDVNPVAGTVAKYAAADPLTPTRFAAGDTADAEPALPGWRVTVNRIMPTTA